MGDSFGSEGGSQNIAKDQGTAFQTNVNYGISPELFAAYVKKLAVTETALNNFFKIMEQEQVPLEELDSRLREIASSTQKQVQHTQSKHFDLDSIPYPIATAFRRIKACHQKDVKRLKYILQTFETAIVFFAIVALNELFEKAIKNETPIPPSLTQPVQNLMNRPSFARWLEILRGTTRFLSEYESMFMPELRSFVFSGNTYSPSNNMHMANEMLTVRNRFANGDMQPEEILKACETCEKMTEKLLQNIQFMANYSPYYVRQINVRRRRHSETKFSHQFWRLSGPYQDPDALSEERSLHTDTDDIIIENSKGDFVNLHPLYLYICSEKQYYSPEIHPDLYVFNGFENTRDGINISYQPCGSGGRAFKSLELKDTEERALLNRGIQEYLDFLVA
jgi:hypothetical protein